jgi:hypothetical protein
VLSRTLVLAPHEELAREALAIARRGRRVDVAALNRAVLHASKPLR